MHLSFLFTLSAVFFLELKISLVISSRFAYFVGKYPQDIPVGKATPQLSWDRYRLYDQFPFNYK